MTNDHALMAPIECKVSEWDKITISEISTRRYCHCNNVYYVVSAVVISTQHQLNSSGTHLNSSGIHLNSSATHLNSSSTYLNSSGTYLNSFASFLLEQIWY